MTKEISVEEYLIAEAKRTGGETRKAVWAGRRGAPDRLCMWPTLGRYAFVEMKLDSQTWGDQPHQAREREKMRASGMNVPSPLWNKAQVDAFIAEMTS